MARYVDQVRRKAIAIQRSEAERIAADLGGRHDEPFGLTGARRDWRRQEREHIIARFFEVPIEFLRFLDFADAAALVLQYLLADLEDASIRQKHRVQRALSVDIGAVCRIEVGGKNLTGNELQFAVPARNVG